MARVIFYSTGEIFWVSDPPPGGPHIGVSHVLPAVPPDHLFTYALAAHALKDGGHQVIGAFGRQRQEVRDRHGREQVPDREFLALAEVDRAERTVLVLIATDSGQRPAGADHFPRIPFHPEERAALARFRARGGGVYATWDHGQLGYESLTELGLADPIEPEPAEYERPNVAFSNDSTGHARVASEGFQRKAGELVPKIVALPGGPPAGYLQKIVPAEVLHRPVRTPHPIFDGVGGADGTWIPGHAHEGKLKIKASIRGIDETALPQGVYALAVHIPPVETTFVSFAVMARQDREWLVDDHGEKGLKRGAVIWDTSFHHLCDINWVSDGKVPWNPFTPFSAEALWYAQLPAERFEDRLDRGMRRLFVNAVSWLAGELPGSPLHQATAAARAQGAAPAAFSGESGFAELQPHQDAYPSAEELSSASPA